MPLKTIRAELFGLTKAKRERIQELLGEWNRALKLERDYRKLREQTRLPSYFCRALSWKVGGKHSPVLLDKDAFVLKRTDNKFARFFVSIPTPSGRAWCPLRMWKKHEELLEKGGVKVRDSMLVERGGRFFIYIVVEAEIKITPRPNVVAVDLGERFLAASVALCGVALIAARLLGGEARGVRRHYDWLRKRLGERKKLRAIKRLAGKERRTVERICHRAAKEVVEFATEHSAVIVVGDLRGLRKRNGSKRLNRIVSSMPYHKLRSYIEYKAAWLGIPVYTVGEAYTSRLCHRCGAEGTRRSQGAFVCGACGLEYNADLNGAANLGKRFLGQRLGSGALWVQALKGD